VSIAVSPDDVRTMEADTFGFWEEFARRPGGETGRAGGATWYRSGVPFANYNGVLGAGCDADEMLARVRSWGLPARWLISTASAGPIEDTFTARGLVMTDEYPAMIAPVSALPAPELNGVTVETAETDLQYREWADALCDGFGLTGESAAHVAAAHAWPCRHDRDRVYMLLRQDGTVVATAMLHTACGVAGIYGIAVRRAYQRRGLGRLATLVTVHAGAERGATIAMLQATKDGFPVYERLGFRTIFAFRSWRIPA
jgi:ribosomal protein S18 acetylase RimI-like enzyme